MPTHITARLLYPDPFSPNGIQLELPADLTLTVAISDADGTVLDVLISETRLNAGTHDLYFQDRPTHSPKRYLTIHITDSGKEQTIIQPL